MNLPRLCQPCERKIPQYSPGGSQGVFGGLVGTTSRLGGKWVRGAKVSTLSAIYFMISLTNYIAGSWEVVVSE